MLAPALSNKLIRKVKNKLKQIAWRCFELFYVFMRTERSIHFIKHYTQVVEIARC